MELLINPVQISILFDYIIIYVKGLNPVFPFY